MFGNKKNSEILKELRGATWQSVLIGILFVLFGVTLLLNPEGLTRAVCYTVGIIFMAAGIVQLIIYFMSNVEKNMQSNRFIVGIILIAIGIFFIAGYRLIMSIIPFVMGILILFNGVMKLQTALDAMKMKANRWGFLLVIAIITIILGLFVAFNPFKAAKTVLRLVGACMIFSGVTDLVNVIYISRGLKNYIKDMEALVQDPKD